MLKKFQNLIIWSITEILCNINCDICSDKKINIWLCRVKKKN